VSTLSDLSSASLSLRPPLRSNLPASHTVCAERSMKCEARDKRGRGVAKDRQETGKEGSSKVAESVLLPLSFHPPLSSCPSRFTYKTLHTAMIAYRHVEQYGSNGVSSARSRRTTPSHTLCESIQNLILLSVVQSTKCTAVRVHLADVIR